MNKKLENLVGQTIQVSIFELTVLKQIDDIVLVLKKNQNDPEPFVVGVGLDVGVDGKYYWRYGKYHTDLDAASLEFSHQCRLHLSALDDTLEFVDDREEALDDDAMDDDDLQYLLDGDIER